MDGLSSAVPIERIAIGLRRAARRAARTSATHTLARAQDLVPTDEGVLAASGKVVDRPDGVAGPLRGTAPGPVDVDVGGAAVVDLRPGAPAAGSDNGALR